MVFVARTRQQALARQAQLRWRRSNSAGAQEWRRRQVLMRRAVPSAFRKWRNSARSSRAMKGRSVDRMRAKLGRRLVHKRTGRVYRPDTPYTLHLTPPDENSYFPPLYDVSRFRG